MNEHITVVGNIANEPERRSLPDGGAIVNFRVAATAQRRQDDGTWVDAHTNWYSVSAYRRLAEHALGSLHRGQRVIVSGRFRLRPWESNGKQGVAAEIDADALGPDLLFGTATFSADTRNKIGRRPDDTAEVAPEAEWAVSAAEADDAGLVPAGGDTAPQSTEPDLVSAGGWDTRPLGDTTPF